MLKGVGKCLLVSMFDVLYFIICVVMKYILNTTAVAQLVEALHYKSKGRGFDSRWRHLNFSLT
jgi:hypothetical protein